MSTATEIFGMIACNVILFFNTVPSEAESVVHTKAKNRPSLEISRGADTQLSHARGSYAYNDWN